MPPVPQAPSEDAEHSTAFVEFTIGNDADRKPIWCQIDKRLDRDRKAVKCVDDPVGVNEVARHGKGDQSVVTSEAVTGWKGIKLVSRRKRKPID
jgi:hypothetical protein